MRPNRPTGASSSLSGAMSFDAHLQLSMGQRDSRSDTPRRADAAAHHTATDHREKVDASRQSATETSESIRAGRRPSHGSDADRPAPRQMRPTETTSGDRPTAAPSGHRDDDPSVDQSAAAPAAERPADPVDLTHGDHEVAETPPGAMMAALVTIASVIEPGPRQVTPTDTVADGEVSALQADPAVRQASAALQPAEPVAPDAAVATPLLPARLDGGSGVDDAVDGAATPTTAVAGAIASPSGPAVSMPGQLPASASGLDQPRPPLPINPEASTGASEAAPTPSTDGADISQTMPPSAGQASAPSPGAKEAKGPVYPSPEAPQAAIQSAATPNVPAAAPPAAAAPATASDQSDIDATTTANTPAATPSANNQPPAVPGGAGPAKADTGQIEATASVDDDSHGSGDLGDGKSAEARIAFAPSGATDTTGPLKADKPAASSPPVTEQVAVHIARAARDGISRLHLALEPGSLGRLDISLEIHRDGRVAAVITADNPQTLDVLRGEAKALTQSLNSAGLKADLDSVSFGFRASGEGPSGNGAGNHGEGQRSAAPATGPDHRAVPDSTSQGDAIPRPATRGLTEGGRLDIRA